jgi:hypothetical protein
MLERYEHVCLACGEVIYSYSPVGRDTLVRIHDMDHEKERIRNMVAFDEAFKKKPPKNYNALKVSRFDAGFLKTRGIKLDDEIEIDWGQEPKYGDRS